MLCTSVQVPKVRDERDVTGEVEGYAGAGVGGLDFWVDRAARGPS